MIQRDPTLRCSADEYLDKFRDVLFPEVFYSTLQSYFDILALQPLSKPDSRMYSLWQDIRCDLILIPLYHIYVVLSKSNQKLHF